ncbi:Exostosin-like 3 [Aphelenchoides fujianensis]|nr:Exostosin-like 3 [Aphelenchoides fujianensis]
MLPFGQPTASRSRFLNVRFFLFVLVFFFCSYLLLYVYLDRDVGRNWSGVDVDDYCLKRNKWGGFDDRVAEQRRIFASVREEHLEVLRKFEETSHEFAKLMQLIPQKQDELEQLNQKIEMLKLAARELQDQRNVRLFLPHSPLWPPKEAERKDVEDGEKRRFATIEEAFDFSRCSISTRFRVFVYERKSFADEHAARLYDELRKLPYRTEDPTKACVFAGIVEKGEDPRRLSEWKENGRNHLLFLTTAADSANFGAAIVVAENLTNPRPRMDHQLLLDVDAPDSAEWTKLPALLPRDNKFLLSYQSATRPPALIAEDLERMRKSAGDSLDAVHFELSCTPAESNGLCGSRSSRLELIKRSLFTLIFDHEPNFQRRVFESLLGGSIPLILSSGHTSLPFDGLLDWRLAVVRLPSSRLPEVHFIARSFSTADTLEMRRKGANNLINSKVLVRAVLASVRHSLQMPGEDEANAVVAAPAFRSGFSPPHELPITPKPGVLLDEEYVGPLEQPIDSAAYHSNMSALGMYTYELWNKHPHFVDASPEFLAFAAALPSGAEFDEAASSGMRPIAPGSGQEFSLALGGNRIREQFTIVILTHNRDDVLAVMLEKINRCPYVNRVLVVWNNPDREPPDSWPKLHVPVLFIKAERNSLNNRFLPYDQIRTEAVLSLDDDIDFKAPEIVFAFRVWRENRERIVGLPARYHARYGDELFYNSNHTCQLSMILTGAAFLHKSYFYAYSNQMPAIIREKVDEWMNCEDLAMNFLVAHLTRRPPIKATNKWTIRCPTCPETLSGDAGHFDKRSRCIRFFVEVYGYNPLMFTQFRADSVLYRTRVPVNHQKCFRFV